MVRGPASVASLYIAAGLEGPVTSPWGMVPPVPLRDGGVYVVSLESRTRAKRGASRSVQFLPPHVAARWHIGQTVMYVGKTRRNLRKRLGEYFRHRLGNPSPHCGGEDVLRLRAAGWQLWVHWLPAQPERAAHIEAVMLERFASSLPDHAAHRLPFANRQRSRLLGVRNTEGRGTDSGGPSLHQTFR